MKKKFFKKTKGFTLIELLVVITILGLFITMSVLAVLRYQRKAVDTRVKAAIAQVRNIATMIYTDDSNYNSLCASDNTLNDQHSRFGKNLKIIEDDVKNFTGQDVDCYALGPNYCVQSILVEGGSFCTDAEGKIGEEDVSCGSSNIKCLAP